MARKATYRRAALSPAEDSVQGADLTEFFDSYEELCASVRLAGRWILGRARNSRDQRLLTRFRETLRTAEELLDRTEPMREPEASNNGARDRKTGQPGKLIQFPEGKQR